MSATIMAGERAIAVAITKTDIYSAIMDGRTGRGFSLIVDGQEAAEIVAAITPEGYEYTGEFRQPKDGEYVIFEVGKQGAFGCQYAILRRIAPPVEYEYVTDEKPREVKEGDWLPIGHDPGEVWFEIKAGGVTNFPGKRLCYRRVEVKR